MRCWRRSISGKRCGDDCGFRIKSISDCGLRIADWEGQAPGSGPMLGLETCNPQSAIPNPQLEKRSAGTAVTRPGRPVRQEQRGLLKPEGNDWSLTMASVFPSEGA